MVVDHLPENFRLGIRVIDEQHGTLFRLIDDLKESGKTGLTKENFEPVLDRLISYIDMHFRTEEEMFEKTEYPKTESHIREHEYFVERVNGLARDYYTMDIVSVGEICDFLRSWYERHIQHTDRDYVAHFNEHGHQLR